MSENPYQSPTSPPASHRVATGSLWLGFLIAPAVAPVAGVAIVLAIAVGAGLVGVEINTVSLLILPVVLLTAGLLVSYGLAVLVGLPIVLWLRHREMLTGRTLFTSALLMTAIFALVFAVFSINGSFAQRLTFALVTFCWLTPLTVVATAVFWLLVSGRRRV